MADISASVSLSTSMVVLVTASPSPFGIAEETENRLLATPTFFIGSDVLKIEGGRTDCRWLKEIDCVLFGVM